MSPVVCGMIFSQASFNDFASFLFAVYTSSVGGEVTTAIVLASLWPMFVEAQKSLGGKDGSFRALPF